MRRNEFLNSKIIDCVADEEDVVIASGPGHNSFEVKERDTMEPYTTYQELFAKIEEGAAVEHEGVEAFGFDGDERMVSSLCEEEQ